jgi:Family of unknown function (DUF6228)
VNDTLTIRSTRLDGTLIFHPPVDTDGGYVYEVGVELSAKDVAARATLDIASPPAGHDVDLVEFVQSMADDWRGWAGARRWRSLEGRMQIDATHDGAGHVSLNVTLAGPIATPLDESWSVHIVIVVDAGEQMSNIATALRGMFAPRIG